MTPLDGVKCRMQTMPEVYKSMGAGFGVASKEGALLLGWAPTLIGYSLQGMFKFGLYEIFKDYYSQIVGQETAVEYRTFVYLTASASAEVFADLALCPFEAVKVKMQTSPPSANFPTSFGPAWSIVASQGGSVEGGERAMSQHEKPCSAHPLSPSTHPPPPPFLPQLLPRHRAAVGPPGALHDGQVRRL